VRRLLVIDHDLLFAFWLGRALDQAGYDSFPAASVENARRLLAELKIVVDLVIISAYIPDANSFLTELRQAQCGLAVVAVLDKPAGGSFIFPNADLVEYKPVDLDDDARKDWVETVGTVLMANEVAQLQRPFIRQ
jgi:hypothetical protein